jgi:hypothetical protein
MPKDKKLSKKAERKQNADIAAGSVVNLSESANESNLDKLDKSVKGLESAVYATLDTHKAGGVLITILYHMLEKSMSAEEINKKVYNLINLAYAAGKIDEKVMVTAINTIANSNWSSK